MHICIQFISLSLSMYIYIYTYKSSCSPDRCSTLPACSVLPCKKWCIYIYIDRYMCIYIYIYILCYMINYIVTLCYNIILLHHIKPLKKCWHTVSHPALQRRRYRNKRVCAEGGKQRDESHDNLDAGRIETMWNRCKKEPMCVYIYIYIERERCVYIYIYIERERKRDMYTNTYIYIYIHTYIYTYICIHTQSSGLAELVAAISAEQTSHS